MSQQNQNAERRPGDGSRKSEPSDAKRPPTASAPAVRQSAPSASPSSDSSSCPAPASAPRGGATPRAPIVDAPAGSPPVSGPVSSRPIAGESPHDRRGLAASGDSLPSASPPSRDENPSPPSGPVSSRIAVVTPVGGGSAARHGSPDSGPTPRRTDSTTPSEIGNVHPGQRVVPEGQESARRELTTPDEVASARRDDPTHPMHPADIDPKRVVETPIGTQRPGDAGKPPR